MKLNEVRGDAGVIADHIGSNSRLLVLCCGFTQTLSNTRTYIFIHTNTQSLPVSVFWSGAERASVVWWGSVTHALCLCSALLWSALLQPDTIHHPTFILHHSKKSLFVIKCHLIFSNFQYIGSTLKRCSVDIWAADTEIAILLVLCGVTL